MSTNRERYLPLSGGARIAVSCSAGHTANWSDQGLGRASAAIWETRHASCSNDERAATEAVQADMARRWRYMG